MPKYKGIYGTDRYNFLLALMGYLIHHSDEEPKTLAEVAKHFNLSEAEVKKAFLALDDKGYGHHDYHERFQIDWTAWLDGDQGVRLEVNPGIDDVPKISARQAAALTTGLIALKSVPGFTETKEVDELIAILKLGTAGTEHRATIAMIPGTVDADALTIRRAIAESKRISCEYRNAQGVRSERDLDPLVLFSQDEIWYVWAYCPKHEEVRSFRLDRMTNSVVLDEPISETASKAKIPDQVYVPSKTDTRVTLQVQPEAARLITDFRPDQEPTERDGGWLEFDVMVGDLQILGKVIAHYGGKAKVIAPDAARIVVRDYALRALGQDNEGFNQSQRFSAE